MAISGPATRYIGDAIVSIVFEDDDTYSGVVLVGGHAWQFDNLHAPRAGLGRGVAYDSPEAYDKMAASAVSWGSAYTTGERGDAPDWAPPAEVADSIAEAASWAMDDKGRYDVSRKPRAGGPALENARRNETPQRRHVGAKVVQAAVPRIEAMKAATVEHEADRMATDARGVNVAGFPGAKVRILKKNAHWSEKRGAPVLMVELQTTEEPWHRIFEGTPDEVRSFLSGSATPNSGIFEVIVAGKRALALSFVDALIRSRENFDLKWRDRVEFIEGGRGEARIKLRLMVRAKSRNNALRAIEHTSGVGDIEYSVVPDSATPNTGKPDPAREIREIESVLAGKEFGLRHAPGKRYRMKSAHWDEKEGEVLVELEVFYNDTWNPGPRVWGSILRAVATKSTTYPFPSYLSGGSTPNGHVGDDAELANSRPVSRKNGRR